MNSSQEILNYIHQQLTQGVGEERVRAALMQNGWTQQALDTALNDYYARTTLAHASPENSKKPKSKNSLIISVSIIAALIVISIPVIILTLFSQPSLQRSQQTTAQKNDASQIMLGVNQYRQSHAGKLPTTVAGDDKTLYLCGSSCTSDKVSVPLEYYTAGSILLRSYSSNITAPDIKTLSIISGATCEDNTLKSAASPNTSALLYLLENERQDCLQT